MDTFKPGEHVLLWGRGPRREYEFFRVYEPGKTLHLHVGHLTFPEALQPGTPLDTHRGVRLWALRPTVADRMMHVKRATTILYPKDMGWAFFHSHVGPGRRVLEVGSGSGATTIALAYWCGEEGEVFTFERREDFLRLARRNVGAAGLEHRVRFHHQDLAETPPLLESPVDAVLVDVPQPWELVPVLRDVLVPGGSWVSLSPTVEQAERTVRALRAHGFIRVRTVEILERDWLMREGKSRPVQHMVTFTGFLTRAFKGVDV